MKQWANNKLRLGVIGPSGIGKVHIRIFHSLGLNISAVLGRSRESLSKTLSEIDNLYHINPKSFTNIDHFFTTPLDAITICTPPELHYQQILSAFQVNLPVFCEKPLFWNNELDNKKFFDQLAVLENHPFRRIFVNTSNTVFVDYIEKLIPELKLEDFSTFTFIFHTQGRHSWRDIAVDLLPHGISILIRIFGVSVPINFIYEISRDTFNCRFTYQNVCIEFNFFQKNDCEKKFVLILNGREFRRTQTGQGDSYKVFIKDVQENKLIEVNDPFFIYISKFVQFVKSKIPPRNDMFHDAFSNMKIMNVILNKIDL